MAYSCVLEVYLVCGSIEPHSDIFFRVDEDTLEGVSEIGKLSRKWHSYACRMYDALGLSRSTGAIEDV